VAVFWLASAALGAPERIALIHLRGGRDVPPPDEV
jgi:hypothetical protein